MSTMTTATTSTKITEPHDVDVLAELQVLAAVLRMTRAEIDERVPQAHDSGASWGEISKALGVGKTKVFKQYAPAGIAGAERAREIRRAQFAQWKQAGAALAQMA